MRYIRQFAFAATVIGICLTALAATQVGWSRPGQGGSAAAADLTETSATPTPSPRPEPPGQHAPTAQDADENAFSGITEENISFEGHDADFCGAGQAFSISIVTLPPHGTLSNQDWPGVCQDQPANGYALLITTFDYTSDAGFVGTDTITFAYSDGFQTGNVATFTMHVRAGEATTPTRSPTPPAPPTPTPTLPGTPPPTSMQPTTPTPTPTSPTTPAPVGDPTPTATSAPAPPTPTATPTPPGQSTPSVQAPAPTPGGHSPAPTLTPTRMPAGPVLGNWDCDGNVSSADALKELRYVAALPVTQNEPCPEIGTETVSRWGDVDCDGDITAVDALKILRHVAGLSVSQTEPCADIGAPLG